MLTNNVGTYNDYLGFVGRSSLGTDMEYSGDMPDSGFIFYAPFDVDDFPDVTDELDGRHPPYMRSYNARSNGGTQRLTRLDNPSWVFYLDDDQWEEGYHLSSDELDAYASAYLDSDPSDDLPALNSTVSNELFYVPNYSEDSLFQKYGHVDNSISREDFLGGTLDDMLAARLDTSATVVTGYYAFYHDKNWKDDYLIVEGLGDKWGNEETDMSTYSMYREAFSNTQPDVASKIFGSSVTASVPLLSDYDANDPVVQWADEEYREDLQSFAATKESQGKKVYRLTYDACLSDTYDCNSGPATSDNGTWTGSDVQASKTDAVFDFHFIDFTFHDGDKVYTLPAASDPFDIAGPIDTNAHPESGLPTWAWILIGVVAIILVLVVLSLLFPVLKGVVRGIGYAFQIVIDLAYLVLVWWWLAIIRKVQGEELPPAWIWRKG